MRRATENNNPDKELLVQSNVFNPARWAILALLFLGSTQAFSADLPDFSRLVEENAPAVVHIAAERKQSARRAPEGLRGLEEFFRGTPRRMPFRSPRSLGSGFVISSDGYILTNHHVVQDADEILVRLHDRRELVAETIGADPRSDLALLKVNAKGLPAAEIGSSETLKVGEWVFAIGSPFDFEHSATAGIVSAKGRSLPTENNENYVPFIQTDVAINPGNSGGPLFNLEGKVVGINSQIYSRSGGYMGISFAVPVDVAMEVVAQLRESGEVSRGWLGVTIQPVTRDLADSFGLDHPHGALIAQVQANSPAERGGLVAGDIIVTFNGTRLERSAQLPHLVGRTPAESEADVVVVRAGERETLKIRIGKLAPVDGEAFARRGAPGETSGLGLALENLPERFNQQGVEIGEAGVRVVRSSGAARDAGIRRGDIIVALAQTPIADVASFREVASKLTPGRRVPVQLLRSGGQNAFVALLVPEE